MDLLSTRLRPVVNRWAQPTSWPLAWLLALLMAGLMVSVVVAAASDPDWDGTVPENISHSDQLRAWQPDIALDSSGRVVVVWSDQRSGDRNIYTISDDGGTWSEPQVIRETAESSWYPDVLAVGDEIFVAWVDLDTTIYEAGKTAIGTWETRQIPSPVSLFGTQARLAAGAGRLHIVFNAGETVSEIYHASRTLTETAWPTAKRIYTSTAWGSWLPALAAGPNGETLHVVWQDHHALGKTIMYMSGTVSAADVDWSSAITLSTGITSSRWSDIAVDSSGTPHIIWGEQGGGGYDEQYVRYTRYASGSWIEPAERIDPIPVQANKDSPSYIAPCLALWEKGDQETVCVAWYGFRAGDPQAEDVLLRCSQDGGDTWTSTQTENVSHSSEEGWGISFMQSAVFDASGRLHVVWQERAGENVRDDYEIYYSRAMSRVYLPLVMRSG